MILIDTSRYYLGIDASRDLITIMNNNQFKTLRELIIEALDFRGLNVEKLTEVTDIPKYYLTALTTGDFKKLPAAPYVRGYLLQISEILQIDQDLLWEAYQKESSLYKTSGPQDKLPSNRFAFKNPNKRKTVIIIVLLIIITFSIWQFDEFFGTPKIEIISPAIDNLTINAPSIKLAGKVNARDKLIINNEEILVDENGRFEKEFSLQPGINTVEFRVKRFLGKEIKVIRQIIYQQ